MTNCEGARSNLPIPSCCASSGRSCPGTQVIQLTQSGEVARHVAIHESSHVVLGLYFGLSVRRVRIGRENFCELVMPPNARSTMYMGRICGALAGDIAQRWARRRLVYRLHDEHLQLHINRARLGVAGGCDLCGCVDLLVSIGLSDTDLFSIFRQLEEHTHALLRRPEVSAAIEIVADALMERGELVGDEVVALVDFALIGAGLRELEAVAA